MPKLTENMKAAFKNYFDTKANGNGFFLVPGEKEKCLDLIGAACNEIDVSCFVYHGLIEIHWNKGVVTMHGKDNWETGCTIEEWAKPITA